MSWTFLWHRRPGYIQGTTTSFWKLNQHHESVQWWFFFNLFFHLICRCPTAVVQKSWRDFICHLFLPSPHKHIHRYYSAECSSLFKEKNHVISENTATKSRKNAIRMFFNSLLIKMGNNKNIWFFFIFIIICSRDNVKRLKKTRKNFFYIVNFFYERQIAAKEIASN